MPHAAAGGGKEKKIYIYIYIYILRATQVLRRGDCSVLGVWELYFITGLVSDGGLGPE